MGENSDSHSVRRVVRRLTLADEFLVPYPALAPAAGMLFGVLTAAVPGLGLASWRVVALTALPAAGGLTVVFRHRWRNYAGMLLLGMALTGLHLWAPWQTYRRSMPGRESFVHAKAVVTDTRLMRHPDLAWLQPQRSIKINLTAVRLTRDAPWRACRGTVIISRPGEVLQYGQEVLVAGALQEPWSSDLPHQFNYSHYLRTTGIQHLFAGHDLQVTTAAARGRRRLPAFLLRVRESIVLRLLDHIDDPEDAKVLAAMTLGLRAGMTPEDRRLYLRCGELHLFAISGLHVGIAFSLVMLLLAVCRTPYRWRFFIAPAALLVYVAATGAAPSALRAWLMLTIWAVGRGFRLPVKPVNTVLATGIILLLLNPLQIFQTGFQYSFILVLALLVGWRWGIRLTVYLREHHRWVPFRAQEHSWRGRVSRLALQGLTAMLIFWLSAVGLTAWHNQLFMPLSVLSNLFAGVLAWLILFGSVVKVVVSSVSMWIGWSFPSRAVAWLLGVLVYPLRGWAQFSAAHGGVISIARPPLLLVLGYYIALGAVVLSPARLPALARRLLVLTAAAAMLLSGGFRTAPRVDVFVPAEACVPVVVVAPRGQPPIIINAGTGFLGYGLAQWLQGEGVDRVQAMVLLGSGKACAGGTERLLQASQVDSVAVLARQRRRLAGLRALAAAAGARWRQSLDGNLDLPGIRVRREDVAGETRHHISIANAETGRIEILLRRIPLEKSVLTISRPGQPPQTYAFGYGSRDRHLRIPRD